MRIIIILFALTANATTYYIAANGSDSNNGTSTATPWAHLRGMATCTATCASTTPAAGDRFIFKGGDTWGNSNFQINWAWSGSTGNQIYVGVDKTWYTGTAWTQPKFDLEDAVVATNNRVFLITANYVTIEDFEITRFRWEGKPAYGQAFVISFGTSTYINLNKLYVHSWTHDTPAGCDGDCDALKVIVGSSTPDTNPGVVVDGLICDGAPSGTDSGMCTYALPTVVNSIARNMSNGILVSGLATVTGNHVYNINESYDAGQHENCIEVVGGAGVTLANNLVHNCTAIAVFVGGGTGPSQDYIFNNVIYGSTPIPIQIDTGPTAGGSAFIYNNTIVETGVGTCIRAVPRDSNALAAVTAKNNLCISDTADARAAILCDSTQSGSCAPVTSITLSTNLAMTQAAATTAGYVSGNTYAPPGGGATIGAGANLSSLGITALNSDKNGVARGSTWDIGATEYAAPPPLSTIRSAPALRGVAIK